MGNKRLKLARGVGGVIPTTINFSELEREMKENNVNFDPSDNGFERQRLDDSLEYEELIVRILYNLEARERLVFVYQLLRDNGFQIDHTAFAKTIHIGRRQYMRILDRVRMKSMLFMMAYRRAIDYARGTNRT